MREKKEMKKKLIHKRIPAQKEAIWIAKDICFNSCSKRNWWYRMWARLLLGWKIKDIKNETNKRKKRISIKTTSFTK